jgi:Immunity protein 30
MTKIPAENLDESLANLRFVLDQGGAGVVSSIDAVLGHIGELRDPRCISELLLMLDDYAEYEEAMFSLIHAAESFNDHEYIHQLLTVLPTLQVKTPKWASVVLVRIINNQATRDELIARLKQATTEVRKSVVSLCEKINMRGATLISKTLPVLLAAKDRG